MLLKKPGNAFVYPHDPSEKLDYMFVFRLESQEEIASALVQVVDPETGEPPVTPTDLILSDMSFGETEVALEHGVTIWIAGGTPSKSYYLTCTITTTSSPVARTVVRTMRLLCADQ